MKVKDLVKTAITCGLVLWAAHLFIFALLLFGANGGEKICGYLYARLVLPLYPLLRAFGGGNSLVALLFYEGVGFALFCLALRVLPISSNVKRRVSLLYVSEIAAGATAFWELLFGAASGTGHDGIWYLVPAPAISDLLHGFFFIAFFLQVFDAFHPRERAHKVMVVFLAFAVGFLHAVVLSGYSIHLDLIVRATWAASPWLHVIWHHELFDMVPLPLFLVAIACGTLLGCVALAVRRKRLETKEFFSRSVNEKMGKRKPAASKGGER